MELKFTKMHGCGNDYIFVNCMEYEPESPGELSKILSDRHFGVGGDGLVLMLPSDAADARMRMFNLDGSEGRMCGNAIRCVGKYLYDNGIIPKNRMTIETLSGIKELELDVRDFAVHSARVDMGRAEFEPGKIPVSLPGKSIISREVSIDGMKYRITCVSMGNPHAVVFVDDVEVLDLEKLGPRFERAPIFPERVNTEFAELIDGRTIKMRVWERGSGETLACGTGACATVAAAAANGHCREGEDVTVRLRGGELVINCTRDAVYMTGNCVKVFDGTVTI